jgi:hypothetical protein
LWCVVAFHFKFLSFVSLSTLIIYIMRIESVNLFYIYDAKILDTLRMTISTQWNDIANRSMILLKIVLSVPNNHNTPMIAKRGFPPDMSLNDSHKQNQYPNKIPIKCASIIWSFGYFLNT